ncbi:MAG: hypothetical protein IJ390_08020 [Lachnospiraceae bacterium]|nr:hypothetical protein [Lachnospiraceae bacterium]
MKPEDEMIAADGDISHLTNYLAAAARAVSPETAGKEPAQTASEPMEHPESQTDSEASDASDALDALESLSSLLKALELSVEEMAEMCGEEME